jgi:hypothetical protein
MLNRLFARFNRRVKALRQKFFLEIAKKLVAFFSALHSRRNRALHHMNFFFPRRNRQYFLAVPLLASGFLLLSSNAVSAQVVFSQDFSAGGTPTTYTGSGANLFDGITTANSTNLSWSITSGTLQGVRSNTTSAGEVSRTTNLATTSGGIYQFTINVISSSVAATSELIFYSGTGFTTANGTEPSGSFHSRFGVNLNTTGGYMFRNIDTLTNSATTFTGSNNVFFVVNNTGSTFTYTAPNATSETAANDTWDLWVGSTEVFNDQAAATATVAPTDFKLLWQALGTATIQFDNFTVIAIPEPSTWLAGALAVGAVAFLQRRKRSAAS